jgi:hypothetical protein
MNDRREENWRRRKFVGGLTLGGTAGLLGLQAKQVTAQPPPETTRITVDWSGSTCQAPRWVVAEELLRAEGFMVQSPWSMSSPHSHIGRVQEGNQFGSKDRPILIS